MSRVNCYCEECVNHEGTFGCRLELVGIRNHICTDYQPISVTANESFGGLLTIGKNYEVGEIDICSNEYWVEDDCGNYNPFPIQVFSVNK